MNQTTSLPQVYQIPGLPEMEAKPIRGLGPVPLNNVEWREWYPEVIQHRNTTTELTEEKWSGQAKAREKEIERVKDGRYWQSVYGPIYNPKDPEVEEGEDEDWITETESKGYMLPFVPYVFQLYYWEAQYRAFRSRGPKGDVVVLKSRQMGLSNTACSIFSHAWMTKKPFQGRLLSRKEDLVDESNNPDSLFWKIDLQLRATPKWMLQHYAPGFDWRFHRMLASITNPANLNHLAGESTNATAGRGGAATALLLDELAFMRGAAGIWTATRAATWHRIGISTASLKLGTLFYDLVQKKDDPDGPTVLIFPHFLHPEQEDPEWATMERARDPVGFETEVMMNFFGDISDFVYPGMGNKTLGHYPYIPYGGDVFVAFDDGFTGYWACLVIQYVEAEGRHRIIDAFRDSGKITDFYGSLFRHTFVDGFSYDANARGFMETMRLIQAPIFVGDTHGKHVETTSGMSVIERLAERWGIYVNVDYQNRDEKDRQEYLGKIIPYLDFNDNARVAASLKSMQRYRWKEIEDSDELTSIPKSPIKNHDSHDPTALEYYATNWEYFKNIYIPGGRIQYGG